MDRVRTHYYPITSQTRYPLRYASPNSDASISTYVQNQSNGNIVLINKSGCIKNSQNMALYLIQLKELLRKFFYKNSSQSENGLNVCTNPVHFRHTQPITFHNINLHPTDKLTCICQTVYQNTKQYCTQQESSHCVDLVCTVDGNSYSTFYQGFPRRRL